jgi:predicted glycogen debranching enzyme
MDAKVGDWVVTPRRGKAVEINALWYNALRLLEGWLRRRRDDDAHGDDGGTRSGRASVQPALLVRGGGLSVRRGGRRGRGTTRRCRPNQIFAIALPHPVLDPAPLGAGVEVVRRGC